MSSFARGGGGAGHHSRKNSNSGWKSSSSSHDLYRDDDLEGNDDDEDEDWGRQGNVEIKNLDVDYKKKPQIASESQTSQQKPSAGPVSGAGADDSTLYLTNLSFSLKEEDLNQLFKSYNLNVVKIKLLLNDKGQSKGAGYVEFVTPEDADFAFKEMNGIEYDQSKRKLTLTYSKNKGSYGGGVST